MNSLNTNDRRASNRARVSHQTGARLLHLAMRQEATSEGAQKHSSLSQQTGARHLHFAMRKEATSHGAQKRSSVISEPTGVLHLTMRNSVSRHRVRRQPRFGRPVQLLAAALTCMQVCQSSRVLRRLFEAENRFTVRRRLVRKGTLIKRYLRHVRGKSLSEYSATSPLSRLKWAPGVEPTMRKIKFPPAIDIHSCFTQAKTAMRIAVKNAPFSSHLEGAPDLMTSAIDKIALKDIGLENDDIKPQLFKQLSTTAVDDNFFPEEKDTLATQMLKAMWQKLGDDDLLVGNLNEISEKQKNKGCEAYKQKDYATIESGLSTGIGEAEKTLAKLRALFGDTPEDVDGEVNAGMMSAHDILEGTEDIMVTNGASSSCDAVDPEIKKMSPEELQYYESLIAGAPVFRNGEGVSLNTAGLAEPEVQIKIKELPEDLLPRTKDYTQTPTHIKMRDGQTEWVTTKKRIVEIHKELIEDVWNVVKRERGEVIRQTVTKHRGKTPNPDIIINTKHLKGIIRTMNKLIDSENYAHRKDYKYLAQELGNLPYLKDNNSKLWKMLHDDISWDVEDGKVKDMTRGGCKTKIVDFEKYFGLETAEEPQSPEAITARGYMTEIDRYKADLKRTGYRYSGKEKVTVKWTYADRMSFLNYFG